jgi:NAD(P)-dependent dehydrogenase (short-subunit alcohol dehydrogenase family)
VNAVTPGPFPSKQVQKADGFIKALTEKTLLKRIGQPEDLAGAFIFLSSDASNYMTGQNIVIDGGWTAK